MKLQLHPRIQVNEIELPVCHLPKELVYQRDLREDYKMTTPDPTTCDTLKAKYPALPELYILDTTVIDEKLVASISRLLTSAKIPCVLWGNYLLTIYGVPSIVNVSCRLGLYKPLC
jgi:hypothetical protein